MLNEEGVLTLSDSKFIHEAPQYWEARARRFARQGAGLPAVCSYGMPWFYNRYIHLTQWLALRRWLIATPGAEALEIGCGIGRWTRLMARRGVSVTGVDIAPTMIAEARRRTAAEALDERCSFVVSDLASLALARQFDFILGVTVLQHVLDHHRFERSVHCLAAHLSQAGRLVLLEAAPSKPNRSCNSPVFHARAATEYVAAFSDAGLRLVALEGVDPMPFKTLLLPWYRRLPRSLAVALLAGVTAVSLPLDIVLARRLPAHCWHKVFVFAK